MTSGQGAALGLSIWMMATASCGVENAFDERTSHESLSAPDGGAPPSAGAPCTAIGEIKSKSCGACGTAETVCLGDGKGGGKWSDYSACTGELAGGCVPGTTVTEACGNCDTMKKNCTQYCAYTSGASMGQPAQSCAPGSVDSTTAGCSGPGTYRSRTCGAACTWGKISVTCEEPKSVDKLW